MPVAAIVADMCGRFTQQALVGRAARADGPRRHAPRNLRPRYNVAPSQDVAVARVGDPGSQYRGKGGPHAFHAALGVDPLHGRRTRRSATSSSMPGPRRRRRSPPSGRPSGIGAAWSRPTASTNGSAGAGPGSPGCSPCRDGAPLVFAGLWERWTVPEGAALTGSLAERGPGDAVETCTILTTAANETVAPVHGRMPVILPPRRLGCLARGRGGSARTVPGSRHDGPSGVARTSTGRPTTTRAAWSRFR